MKILQLCKKFPFPLNDGESIAVTFLSKALADLGCEMTLLSMNTSKHFTDIEKLPNDFNHYSNIIVTELDNSLKPMDAFLNLFSKDSYHVSRFVSDDFRDALIDLLQSQKFDVIQLETLYLAPYMETIRQYSDALITMRAHNVEHEIWYRVSKNTSLLPKKWYIKYLAHKLKRFEIEMLNEYDYLVAVTDRDLKRFKKYGYKNGAVASPIGIDISEYESKEMDWENPSVSFIGSLDWMPNLEGVEWFLSEVWPIIHEKYPALNFEIAGRNMPAKLKKQAGNNVVMVGEVPSAIDFINQHAIMVVPLLSGSGMRVKILEGMALGKVVITTSIGLEGIHAKHGSEVFIANTPQEFMECITLCMHHPKIMQDISKKAQLFIADYFDNQSNAKKLKNLYKKLLVQYSKTSDQLVNSN